MKIAVCFGTRPEVIKLAMLVDKMQNKFEVRTVFTGQHGSLYEDVKNLMPYVNYNLQVGCKKNMASSYSAMTDGFQTLFADIKPDLVVVQGDTASSYCAAFVAFTMGIKIGHVEAGLRTYDMASPFPEEFNRQMIGKIASYHWCPSELAASNLKKENVNGVIVNTGNTIVDFVQSIIDVKDISSNNEIIVTLHRRENKDFFESMLRQIDTIATQNPNLSFIFPAHPNPNIQKHLSLIGAKNFKVVPPYGYVEFVKLLSKCKGIITDSGGIQEEAICLGKKVLVCRNTTERNEGIDIGIARLVNDKILHNFDWLLIGNVQQYKNPYGDGHACENIIETIK